MSRVTHQDLEGGNNTADGHHDQLGSAPSQPSQFYPRELQGFDSSWPLYSMYSKVAQEEDNKMAERCQKDADGTIIFAGLFMTVVATSLTVTFQDLRPNSQDISAFYLENIYQLLASPNAPTSIPTSLAKPPAFSAPAYAVWVNALFFLSGVLSVVAAIWSILRQQWAQRFIIVTQQPSYTPEQRARIRAVFDGDTRGFGIMPGSSAPSFCIPLSVLAYIIGGVIYLLNVNRDVFIAVVWLVMIGMMTYGYDTVKVNYKHDTLFYSPFSPLAFRVHLGILYAVHQVCSYITPLCGLCEDIRRRYGELSYYYREGFLKGRQYAAEEIISRTSSKIDAQVLEWTFQSCRGESDGLEKLIESIPGFFSSKAILNLGEHLSNEFRAKLADALQEFLDNTFSSDSFSESVRAHRLVTCLNATRTALGSNDVSRVLDYLVNGRWREALRSAEVGHSLRRWCDEQFSSPIRRIDPEIISSIRERDNPHPAPLDGQGLQATSPDVTAAGATQDTPAHSPISGLAYPTSPSRSASRAGSNFARQQVKEREAVTPSIIFGPPSIPIAMPGVMVSRDAISEPHHLSLDSAVLRFGIDDIRHISESSSPYSAAALPSILSNVSAQHTTRSTETIRAGNDSDDHNLRIPTEAFPHPLSSGSTPLDHGISTNTLQREDHRYSPS